MRQTFPNARQQCHRDMFGSAPSTTNAWICLLAFLSLIAAGYVYSVWQEDASELRAAVAVESPVPALPRPLDDATRQCDAEKTLDTAVYRFPPILPHQGVRQVGAMFADDPLPSGAGRASDRSGPRATGSPLRILPMALAPADEEEPVPGSPSLTVPSVPALPAPLAQLDIPVGDADSRSRVQVQQRGDKLTLVVRDAPLNDVLGVIAEQHGLNLVTAGDATERISLTLTDVTLDQTLSALLTNNGYTWARQGGIVIVTRFDGEKKGSPFVQGRALRVFDLNYLRASDADKIVKGLLSPVGQSFPTESSPLDKLRTREQLAVEDLPPYLTRIEEYLCQVDVPPQQVLVETNILQVTLKNNCKYGINFNSMTEIAGTDVTVGATGFANPLGTPMAFMHIDGNQLQSFVDFLQSTTDVKTLASPKVFVLNGQEAKIQIGGKIGYLETTTTQTSTLQSVNFLPIGVILHVTPFITRDGQVLLQVAPEVSTGRINATTKLPDSETTQVETRVMMSDGQAIVIGGLIKENENEVVNKVPWLGDLWLVGWLFRNVTSEREKSEIIITIRTRIAPYPHDAHAREAAELERASLPLLQGALYRAPRPFEPRFPTPAEHHGCLGAHGWSTPLSLGGEYCPDCNPMGDDVDRLPPVEELPQPEYGTPPVADPRAAHRFRPVPLSARPASFAGRTNASGWNAR